MKPEMTKTTKAKPKKAETQCRLCVELEKRLRAAKRRIAIISPSVVALVAAEERVKELEERVRELEAAHVDENRANHLR